MKIKTIGLKLAGGLLAVAFVVTALASHTARADAGACKPGPCPPDSRPDLALTAFDASVGPGDWMNVTYAFQNEGLAHTGPFKTKVLVNGMPHCQSGWLVGMPSGAMTSSLCGFQKPSVGKAEVQLLIDYDNEVDESNEGNNTAQKLLVY